MTYFSWTTSYLSVFLFLRFVMLVILSSWVSSDTFDLGRTSRAVATFSGCQFPLCKMNHSSGSHTHFHSFPRSAHSQNNYRLITLTKPRGLNHDLLHIPFASICHSCPIFPETKIYQTPSAFSSLTIHFAHLVYPKLLALFLSTSQFSWPDYKILTFPAVNFGWISRIFDFFIISTSFSSGDPFIFDFLSYHWMFQRILTALPLFRF